MKRSNFASVLYFNCALLLYFFGGLVFLYSTAIDYLTYADLSDPLMFADALVYRDYCDEYLNTYSFLFFKSLGPCLQSVFFPNPYTVYFFNSTILIFTCLYFCRNFRINKYIFIFFFFANPMTFFSLIAPNKEIFGAIAIMFTLIYQLRGGSISLFGSIIFCFLSRYSILAFLLFLLLSKPAYKALYKIFGAPRAIGIYFSVVAFALSIFYIFTYSSILPLLLGDVLTLSDGVSTADRISRGFNSLAQQGGLLFVIIIRTVLGLFSPAYGLGSFDLASNGFYYSLASIGSALFFIVVISVMFYSLKSVARLVSGNQLYMLVFAIVAFSLIHGISPTIQNRYWYPIYPLLLTLPLLARFPRIRREARSNYD